MTNLSKLYSAAAKAGIAPFETRETAESETTVDTFNDEVENLTVAESGGISMRGIFEGKGGAFFTDRMDDAAVDDAIDAVRQSAEYGQPADPDLFIRGGSYAYDEVQAFDVELSRISAGELANCAKALSSLCASDARMAVVQVQMQYAYGKTRLKNSNGLDLTHESNCVTVYTSAKSERGGETVNGSYFKFVPDLKNFDMLGFKEELVRRTAGKFGGAPVKSGKYDVVYSPECFSSLISAIGGSFSAFAAEQRVSLLNGKIGERVFSPLLTVRQIPIGKGPYCRPFDAEGVPCKNSVLIENGVPNGYVYDLATAKRAGVASTGNGRLEGVNIRPAVHHLYVEPGAAALDGIFRSIGNGLYITELHGVLTGLNRQSGDYSLQANGYAIEDGKLGAPVSLITVAGNIMTDFDRIIAIGSDSVLTGRGVTAPSVAIGGISVSGL